MSALRAFGGAPLAGDRWVRVLYLDESGVGNIKKDPIVIVAGVIIHADTQWGPLQRRLDDLLTEMTPFGVKKPDFFHATDVFHGSGEFPRDTWSQIRRNSLLAAVGGLVEEFKLPIPWMGVDRAEYARENPDDEQDERLRTCYTVAAVGCFMQAELFMRQRHMDGEVCSCVLEENKQLQKRIPEMIEFLRDPGEETKNLLEGWERVMPLTKMIDHPSPQPKTASSILQLADYCAFAIKRLLEKKGGGRRLTNPLKGHLLRYHVPGAPRRLANGKRPILWNPVHLPSQWGGTPIIFEDGQFRKVDG